MKNLTQIVNLAILGLGLSYGCSNHPLDNAPHQAGTEQNAVEQQESMESPEQSYSEEGTFRESLDSLPSFDVSPYDYSVTTQGTPISSAKTATTNLLTSSTGAFSRGGCESERAKRQVFEDAKSVDSFLCYVKTVTKNDKNMAVPVNKWAYYEAKLNVIESLPPIDVKVRIGQFGQKFSLDVCSAPRGVYRQALEMRLNEDKGNYEGYAVRAEYEANVGIHKMSRVDVTMQGQAQGHFNWMNIEDRHYSYESSGKEYSMHGIFDASDSEKSNWISANVSTHSPVEGDYNLHTVSSWDANKIGSAQFSIVSNLLPSTEEQCLNMGVSPNRLAECVNKCFEQGEGFEVAPDENGFCSTDLNRSESYKIKDARTRRVFTTVANSTSPFYDSVVAQPALEKMSNPKNETDFVEGWNCEAEGEFTFIGTEEIDLIGECGATMQLPVFQSCEKEIWAIRLSA